MKKCKKCSNKVFSKGLCKFHQPKKTAKKIDFNTEDYIALSISELKRITDYWFRQYLLRIHSDKDGKVLCPIKKQKYTKDKINLSHYIDRNVMGLRYSIENCHLLSEQSNMWDSKIPKEGYKSKHHYDFEMYLGEDLVNKLKEKAKEIVILNRQDYINLIKKFKDGGQFKILGNP